MAKDRSADIQGLMGEQADEQTVRRDLASVCRKVQQWATRKGFNLNDKGRDVFFYDKVAWFRDYSITDVLLGWNPDDDPHDTAAMLMDYALSWQRSASTKSNKSRGKEWREKYQAQKAQIKPAANSAKLLSPHEDAGRGAGHTFDMGSTYGQLATQHGHATKSGTSASTAQLLWMLRKVGTITQGEAKSVASALSDFWNRPGGLKGYTGEYHTRFEVMIPLARHLGKFQ
jgi:hypothetical protein